MFLSLFIREAAQEAISKLISLHFGFLCYKRKEGNKSIIGREISDARIGNPVNILWLPDHH